MSSHTAAARAEACIQRWIDLYQLGEPNGIDRSTFDAIIDPDFVEIQTHGVRLSGIGTVVKYFRDWYRVRPDIKEIALTNFYFCSKKNVGFFQWRFSFTYEGHAINVPHACGIVHYKNNKMISITEYEVSGPIVDWDGTAQGTGLNV